MKIIFLDVDGVLNWQGTKDRIGGYIGLCSERIAQLNKITDAVPEAKIVVSSTWRHSFAAGVYDDFNGLVELLKKRGVTGTIIDLTPKRFSYVPRGGEIREWIEDFNHAQAMAGTEDDGVKYEGYADHFGVQYPGVKLETFVVLDDDTDGMEGYKRQRHHDGAPFDMDAIDLRPFHVQTYWDGQDGKSYAEPAIEGGLQDGDVELAIKILNGFVRPVKVSRYNEDTDQYEWVTVTDPKDLTND